MDAGYPCVMVGAVMHAHKTFAVSSADHVRDDFRSDGSLITVLHASIAFLVNSRQLNVLTTSTNYTSDNFNQREMQHTNLQLRVNALVIDGHARVV